MNKYLKKVLPFFEDAKILERTQELVLEPKNNIYFRLDNVTNYLDFSCKMLEFLVRPSYKGTTPYWQKWFRRGLNSYFQKTWKAEDLCLMHTRLGGGCNRKLCVDFILSDFNLEILKEKK